MNFEAYQKGDPNYKSTTRDVFNLLNELNKEKVDGIIIDLRDNGGGSLPEAAMLTDLFVDPGPVVQIRQSDDTISRNYRAYQPAVYRAPVAVLINRLSASASEIFAGAIQDYGRGIVVGTDSFGKGLVQRVFRLPYGTGLTLTNGTTYFYVVKAVNGDPNYPRVFSNIYAPPHKWMGLDVPGSADWRSKLSGWCTSRRRLEITRGWVSSAMSMMRAAPTASWAPNSSISTT